MGFKHFKGLLPLTKKPASCARITQWPPFAGGDTLDKIINDYNERCFNFLKKKKFDITAIEDYLEGIDIVLHDLSTFNQLGEKDFTRIRLMLIDLEYIDDIKTNTYKLKYRMARNIHYFIPQISRTKNAGSCIGDFELYFVWESDPVVISDQETFEKWLDGFCCASGIVVDSISREITTGDGTRMRNLVADIRDAAVVRKLSENDTSALSKQAVAQDFALRAIEKEVFDRTKLKVDISSRREPLVSMEIGRDLSLEEVPLMGVYLEQPKKSLAPSEVEVLSLLGIRKKGAFAVHLDQPNFRDALKSVRRAVKSTEFTAQLPVGLMDNFMFKI